MESVHAMPMIAIAAAHKMMVGLEMLTVLAP